MAYAWKNNKNPPEKKFPIFREMELPYSNIKKFSYVLLFLETETLKKIPFRETKTEAGKSFLYLIKRKPRKDFLHFLERKLA